MKNVIVTLIATTVLVSSVSFACSGHKHHHKPNHKVAVEQPKK